MTQFGSTKLKKEARVKRPGAAFTLIELLVVIAIITVLAGLLFPAGAAASRKMKISRAQSELNQLVTKIETYKLEVGEYPPDNGDLRTIPNNWNKETPEYVKMTAYSPLYYELTGAVFEKVSSEGVFKVSGGTETISAKTLKTYFNVDGVRNSSRVAGEIPFKNTGFKPSQYKELAESEDVELLANANPGPYMILERGQTAADKPKLNPWHYDRTTYLRNNRQSFDLWVDITLGKQTVRIANWSQK